MPILPGETLANKYRIDRLLGQGGMGVVVAAHHIDLDTSVAIKFLSVTAASSSVDRFLREARAAAKVKSEHVCKVFDVGRLDSGEPYIVMEHLEGMDLGQKLHEEGPQRLEDVASWMLQLCDALAEAHQRGIVHRDLKPANVFLARRSDDSPIAKVLDFGISKLPAGAATSRGGRVGGSTTSNGIVGSPLYMAPEQIESASSVDARADIWSIGVMIYELLSQDLPFMGESIISLAMNIRGKPYRPLRELRPELPPEIDAVIAGCLQKDPADRYPNVPALAEAIAPLASSEVQGLAKRINRRRPSASNAADSAGPSGRPPSGPRSSDPELVPADSQEPASNPRSSDPAITRPSDRKMPQADLRRTPVSDKRAYEATEAAPPDHDSKRGLKATFDPVSSSPGARPMPASGVPAMDDDGEAPESQPVESAGRDATTRRRTLALVALSVATVSVVFAIRQWTPTTQRTSTTTAAANAETAGTNAPRSIAPEPTASTVLPAKAASGSPTESTTPPPPPASTHATGTSSGKGVHPRTAVAAASVSSTASPAPAPSPPASASADPAASPSRKPPKHRIDKDNPYDDPP